MSARLRGELKAERPRRGFPPARITDPYKTAGWFDTGLIFLALVCLGVFAIVILFAFVSTLVGFMVAGRWVR